MEGTGTGGAEDMLGENVEAAFTWTRAVEGHLSYRVDGGLAFKHLEPIGRDQNGPAWLIKPVICPPNPLQQARGAFRGADLNDQINRCPVDAEIER